MWVQVLQENLHFYHNCFLVFLPHKCCVHYTAGRDATVTAKYILSPQGGSWVQVVWREIRLQQGLGVGFPLQQLGCRSHFRPTQSLASSPVTDRMTLSHLCGKWERSHLEQKCNHKPFVETGNAPRMKGDHCDGDGILLTWEEAWGSLLKSRYVWEPDELSLNADGGEKERAYPFCQMLD